MTTKKKARKQAKTTEQLRKEAIAQADRNIAAIEAAERGEPPVPPAETKTPVKKKAAKAKASKPAKASGGAKKERKLSGLDAAAKVLVESKEPLNATTIAERAIAMGWKSNGATPHATLYAAMIREIAAKGKASRFAKKDRGLFAAAKGA